MARLPELDVEETVAEAERALRRGRPTMPPFDRATRHLGAGTFVSAMVLGGVFQRHPHLVVGVLELGASWVTGWVRRLDAMAASSRAMGLRPLPQGASAYVRRNVRVAPSCWEEPVDVRALPDVFVFGSDYPHPEGGRTPVDRFLRCLTPHADDAVEAFFARNAATLLPA